MAKSAKRPAIITLLGILGIISGTLESITGLILIFAKETAEIYKDEAFTPTTVKWAGAIILAFGLIKIYIANSVLSGQKWAQIWYGILATLSLVSGIWSIIAHDGVSRWTGLFAAVVAFIVLQLLFSEKSQAYFESES